jgi:adenosylhomocysteine nucleosidase
MAEAVNFRTEVLIKMIKNQMSEIILLLALPCEAKPLIHYFNLKKNQAVHAFPFYQNPDLKLSLIVSGTGMVQAAAATAFAAAQYPEQPLAFVNIGVAGALDKPLGSLWLINRVSDESERFIYPMALSYFSLSSMPLKTLNKPALVKENSLVDLEGFAFYQSATKFSTLELIHSLKIVSDNQNAHYNQIEPDHIQAWIKKQLVEIEFFLKKLTQLVEQTYEDNTQLSYWLEGLSQQLHLTQYQQYQARALIKKLLAWKLEAILENLEKSSISFKFWKSQAEKSIEEFSLRLE